MVDTAPIPESRLEEYNQLVGLLMANCAVDDAETLECAEWISRSALEPGHVWRAMGVESRDEVRILMRRYFPALEAGNDRDMRWKKFLYRRLCGWSGFSA
jgi:nitrogen fixation protein NifQ